jgi:hypothetical protein
LRGNEARFMKCLNSALPSDFAALKSLERPSDDEGTETDTAYRIPQLHEIVYLPAFHRATVSSDRIFGE